MKPYRPPQVDTKEEEEEIRVNFTRARRVSTNSNIGGFYRSSRDSSIDLFSLGLDDSSFSTSLSSHSGTLFTSPAASPKIPKNYDYPQLHIRVFNFPNEADITSDNAVFEETRLDKLYLDRLRYLTELHGVFVSVGLHEEGKAPKRRCSFTINDTIIADLKETDISSKMNPDDVPCSGHSPRDSRLQFDFDPLDNNASGTYPEEIRSATPDELLLQELRETYAKIGDEKDIVEAKRFFSYINYIERVAKVKKIKGSAGEGTKYVQTGLGFKHYFQEFESLLSITDRIKRKIYYLLHATSKKIIYLAKDKKHKDVKFIVHLNHLFTQDAEEIDFGNNAHLLANFILSQGIDQLHVPVFYLHHDDIESPTMVQVGKNGFPLTSDGDLEHMSPPDMPPVAFKLFRGRYDSNEKFIFGLKALYIRLNSPTPFEYGMALAQLCAEYSEDYPEIIKEYRDIIDEAYNSEARKFYDNYTKIPYFNDVYIPILEKILAKYLANPELLECVGASYINTVVGLNLLDHPLSTHGPRTNHPGSHPGEFVQVALYYADTVVILGNEKSYLDFIFHDRKILSKHMLDAHPYWLDSSRPDGHLARQWIDMFEIIALNQALKNPYKFCRYCKIVLNTMDKGRNCDALAIDKLSDIFDELERFLKECGFNVDSIEKRIDNIYVKYIGESAAVYKEIVKVAPEAYRPRFSL